MSVNLQIDEGEISPLFTAYKSDDFNEFSRLIDAGAPVDCLNKYCEPLLNTVISDDYCLKNNKKYFDKLISSGCSIYPAGANLSPIEKSFLSVKNDFYYITKLLEQSTDINNCKIWPEHDGTYCISSPVLFSALETERYNIIDLVLKKYDNLKIYNSDDTPIVNFMLGETIDNIELGEKYFPVFIEKGASIDEFDRYGNQPIHYWAKNYGDYKILDIMIKNKVNINVRDGKGRTALMVACENYNLNSVNNLIKNNVNLDTQSRNGRTALMFSIICFDYEIVNLLLKSKCDKSICDKSGNNICHHFASSFYRSKKETELCEKTFKKYPNLLSQKNNEGYTPLEILERTDNETYLKLKKLHNINDRCH